MKQALAIAIIMIIAVGCADPFSSRDSQPPTGEQGTFIQPISPQIVLFNLEQAYKERITANYMKCLDTGFFFDYDFVTRQTGDNDSGWSYDTEARIIENMFNTLRGDSARAIGLSITPLENNPDQVLDTATVLSRSYTISFVEDKFAENPDTIKFMGTSVFTIEENNQGLWSITRWEDRHQNTNTASWADFKNAYR